MVIKHQNQYKKLFKAISLLDTWLLWPHGMKMAYSSSNNHEA
jgi:hypothetical protein